MPRGIPNRREEVKVEPMSKDELKRIAEESENKQGPLEKAPVSPAQGVEVPNLNNPTVTRRVIGMQGTALGPQVVGDRQTLKKFARKKVDYRGWISVTEADIQEYQRKGILIGHDPDKKLALIKEEE